MEEMDFTEINGDDDDDSERVHEPLIYDPAFCRGSCKHRNCQCTSCAPELNCLAERLNL